MMLFLPMKAGTAVPCFSHRNSVCQFGRGHCQWGH